MSFATAVSLPTRSRFSRCVSGWSTSITATLRSSLMRHARPSNPAPRMTSCGFAACRMASSIATVRTAMTLLAFARYACLRRPFTLDGVAPERKRSTSLRASAGKSGSAVGSLNRATSVIPCAAARLAPTITAVLLKCPGFMQRTLLELDVAVIGERRLRRAFAPSGNHDRLIDPDTVADSAEHLAVVVGVFAVFAHVDTRQLVRQCDA